MKPVALDTLAPGLAAWLDANAEALDAGNTLAPQILPQLGRAGLLRIGVPTQLGGTGGSTPDAIEAVAAVARRSLTAAFVFWGQRTFIEYLLQSDNDALRARWLPALLAGDHAGATGLSNAMKYLSAIEPLQMSAAPVDGSPSRWRLDGALPWITNLRREGFVVAAAFDRSNGAPAIFAVPHDAAGVHRSDDLDLIALRGSNTAALRLEHAVLDDAWLIADDVHAFLSRARPAFLGLQCGMSIGLARRTLEAANGGSAAIRAAIGDEAAQLADELDALVKRLFDGVLDDTFVSEPAALFDVRIRLASIVAQAVQLEVQAAGGRGYLREHAGPARRTREAAFVPIVTPSVVQLKNQLAQYRQQTQAA